MPMRRFAVLLICAVLWPGGCARAGENATANTMAPPAFKTYGSLRYRTEVVDRDTAARRAVANTLRLRAGLATAPVRGFSALVEVTGVAAPGPRRSSNAADVDTRYPTINDPQNLDLSQAVLRYEPSTTASFRLGRQRLAQAGQRFIGPVGFRQTQQTFDAASLSVKAFTDWFFDYNYVWQVRRVVGRRAAGGALDSDSHLLHGSYRGISAWTFEAYGYLFDVETDAFDSATYGGSARYDWPRGVVTFSVMGEAAYQRPYREQPDTSSHHYFMLGGRARLAPWTADLGVEQLAGDAGGAFQTPFATLHKFQGVTDQFLVTPARGVTDGYVKVAYKVSGARLATFAGGIFDNDAVTHIRLSGAAHEFRRQNIDGRLGREWNADAFIRFANATRVGLQGARYKADGFSRDTDKLWLTFEAEF